MGGRMKVHRERIMELRMQAGIPDSRERLRRALDVYKRQGYLRELCGPGYRGDEGSGPLPVMGRHELSENQKQARNRREMAFFRAPA